MVYANPVGQGTHCMQPVEWVGRWLDEGVVVRQAR
jgi:hypothetical protein